MSAPRARGCAASHAPGAVLPVLLCAVVAVGAAGCNIFENIVGIAGVCSTTTDCPAGELCEGCVGDETCVGTCIPITLRQRRFLDDALLDAGPDNEDAGVVIDAGPPDAPAITQFRITFSDHVSEGEPITVEYGTKPGVAYDSRGMAWCQLFMPGEDLVGYEDYAPEPLVRASYGEVRGVDEGVLRDTTITLTCREAVDAGVGDEHVMSEALKVTCDDAQPLPGDVQVDLSVALREPLRTCKIVGGDVIVEGPLLGPDAVDGGAPVDGGGGTGGVPFEAAIERMFADVVAINGSYIYRDVTGDDGLIGFSPPEAGLPIARISGGVALYNNADLEDVSALDGVTIEGSGTIEIGVDVPFSLLVRRNDQLGGLTGVRLADGVPSDVVISDNALLNPGLTVIEGGVGGRVLINNNDKLTTLAVVSGLTSAGALEVTTNEMLSSIALTSLQTLGTEGMPMQTVIDIDLNVVESLVLSPLTRIDGQILVRNLQDTALLDNFEVGGVGTDWTGDTINLSEASAVALAQACDLVFNQWETVPEASITQDGQFFFVSPADCPP